MTIEGIITAIDGGYFIPTEVAPHIAMALGWERVEHVDGEYVSMSWRAPWGSRAEQWYAPDFDDLTTIVDHTPDGWRWQSVSTEWVHADYFSWTATLSGPEHSSCSGWGGSEELARTMAVLKALELQMRIETPPVILVELPK